MAHEPYNFDIRIRDACVDERGTTVDVVSPEAINDRFDRLKRAFVEDEVTREDMDYVALAS
jgi:hypothetical protein